MERISFVKFNNLRKRFLNENKGLDHVVENGENNILISAPHGVSQIRLGKVKVAEIGALSTAIYLKNNTKCYFIAKTKCNNDDANFDEVSSYKNSIRKLVKQYGIKYIIDIHGLASNRECDINLGTHLGNNIKNNVSLFDKLNAQLKSNGFRVSIDQPFMAGTRTICSSIMREFEGIWTLQIEINCGITNKGENINKNVKLLSILEDWINSIK